MSDWHVYHCDRCNDQTTYENCGRLPHGWENDGAEDYCEDCVADRAEEEKAVEAEADAVLAAF